MCGIAGYFGPRDIDEHRIERTLSLMGRRGPDHAGFRTWTNQAGMRVCLLHSRLTIIDFDARANQPLSRGSRTITYNGELYNYLEVRDELAAGGEVFETQSDTEVLLAALGDRSWQTFDRCEGMWAFAMYDESDGSLLLGRDRFGEKPLYCYRDESGFYFGSEVKFIASLLGRSLAVNVDHLLRYLVKGYKALYKGRDTFFHGLEELPAATILRLSADGASACHRYWTPALRIDPGMTYEEAVAGARAGLIRSVELRLRADVPLAFCMSGGVDSNSLIGVAKRVCGYDVHGFTIVNSDERYDERELVEYAVADLAIRHTAIPVRTDHFLEGLRTLVRYHDAPVYTITYYAHWLLMEQIATHGYRIAVSGTGADELFTGYYDHHLAYLFEVRADPARATAARAAWEKHVRPWVRNPHLSDAELFVKDPAFREHIMLDADRFRQYLHVDWWEPFRETAFTDSLLRNRMLNEMFHEAVPVILHEDDLNAMFYSIENRSPFLDRGLFDFCHRIPTSHLIRDGAAKAVLRDAMRGIVPDGVLDSRRKVGFNAPIFSFLDTRDDTVRAAALEPSPIFDYVQREQIEALMDRADLPNSDSKFLFYFLSSKMFLEECAA